MKTLQAYLFRQIIASLLMTMTVFTFVLVVGNVLKEILALLIQRQVTATMAVEAVGLLLPFVWVFALPMAMLTATLLVFGRFSADQELTAARASGISLLSMITPILVLSLLLCGFSALVNLEIAPRCRVAYKELVLKVSVEIANIQLPEGRFIKDYPGYIIFIGKSHGHQLEDVLISQNSTNGTLTAHAARGEYRIDIPNRQIILDLFEAKGIETQGGHGQPGGVSQATITLPLPAQIDRKPKISEMRLSELFAEMREIERRMAAPPPQSTNAPAVTRPTTAAQVKDLTTPIRVQIHRLVATSFACFGFTLVGIPLGIRVHRRETNVGFFIALGLVVIYYGLISVAQTFDTRPEVFPHLILWLPNFVFQAAGAVLLWRANRGV